MAGYSEEKLEYLKQLIVQAITFRSDEWEGMQTADIPNICDPDYIDTDEPEMTADDIDSLFHFNDSAISPGDDSGNFPSDGDSDETPNEERKDYIKDEKPTDDSLKVPGTDSAGLGNNNDKKPTDIDGRTGREAKDYDKITIPDSANLDEIISAILDDKNPDTLNHAIIEFATPSLQDELGVDYELYVKPGQSLTSDTIIGTVTINGKSKEIRSIFDSGTVLANESGTDFKHVYESAGANRHIIIEDYNICGEAPEVNLEAIEAIQDMYLHEAYLNQFISDNLCDSLLPWILLRRYTSYKYSGLKRKERANGREIFHDFMDHIEEIRKEYLEDMKGKGTEDSIRKTKGNIRKINALGYSIIDRRKKYISDLVYAYTDYKESLPKSEYDPKYSDCKFLAYVHKIDYRSHETSTVLGETDYNNYYMALLAKIDISDTQNPFAKEYYELLKNIIEIRMTREKYDLDVIKKEFNDMFKELVNKSYKNAFEELDRAMKLKKEDITVSDVVSWLSTHQSSSKKGSAASWLDNEQASSYVSNDIKQLANIYMFIWNYKPYKVETVKVWNNKARRYEEKDKDGIESIFDLVRQEEAKLSAFWKKLIAEWQTTDLNEIIKKTKELGDNVNKYATWPTSTSIYIGSNLYEHFLFQNMKEVEGEEPDEDLGTDYESTEPVQPTEIDIPDYTQDDLNFNDRDPQDGEPSPIDFKYWQRYFGLATIISIPYLNCGLDILPFIQLIPLPCIFICITSIYIKMFDITIVIGISIRGMYIWPVILFVNLSNQYASILTPLIAQLKNIQAKIQAKLDAMLEKPVNSIANSYINMLENDNRRMRRENIELKNFQAWIKAKKIDGQEKIKRDINKIYDPNADNRQHIINPIAEN